MLSPAVADSHMQMPAEEARARATATFFSFEVFLCLDATFSDRQAHTYTQDLSLSAAVSLSVSRARHASLAFKHELGCGQCSLMLLDRMPCPATVMH